MPLRIPAKPDFPDGHHSEKKVWDALSSQLPDEAVLFHGQRFQERKREYEADLIVAVPGAGWAVIEVKGGDVRRQDGEWQQRQQGVLKRVDRAATPPRPVARGRRPLTRRPPGGAAGPRRPG